MKKNKIILTIFIVALIAGATLGILFWQSNKATDAPFPPRDDMVRGEVNVMSFNVLSGLWNYAPYPIKRVDGNIAQITAYKPDVAGLQEVDESTYVCWKKQFEETKSPYVFAENTETVVKNDKSNTNFCAILYNSSKLELLASGTEPYASTNDNVNCRVMAWAKFKIKSSKKEFLLLNTHWNLTEEGRILQAAELAEFAQKLMADQGTTNLFATGDFNAAITATSYPSFLSATGYSDSSDKAETKGLLVKTTHSWTNTKPQSEPVTPYAELQTDEAEFAKAIDHIAYNSNGTTAKYFTVISNDLVWNSSDHLPIFATFDLPK